MSTPTSSAQQAVAIKACYACRTNLEETEEYLCCKVKGCPNLFHHLCASGKTMAEDAIQVWVCPECRNAQKKGGDNSHTPVGASKLKPAGVTIRTKPAQPRLSDEDFRSSEYLEIMTEIRAVQNQVSGISMMLGTIIGSLSGFKTEMDALAKQTSTFNSKLEYLEGRAKASLVQEPVEITADSGHTAGTAHRVATVSPAKNKAKSAAKTPKNPQAPNAVQIKKVETKSVEENEEGWIEVRKKVRRRPVSLHGTAGPSITSLRAVEPKKYFHLWNMVSGLDEVKPYVEQLCSPEAFTVEELSSKGSYKSYKIGVPDALFSKCSSKDVWPVHARIKEWLPFREFVEACKRRSRTASQNKRE